MSEFLSNSAAFGVLVSLLGYFIGTRLKKRWNFPLFNPFLIAIIFTIGALLLLKVDYDHESGARKAELEQQRARVKSLESTVDPALLAEYMAIKKHTSPPVARLQYGQCSGCNTSLPSATLSKIRNGNLVECETCGRMIIQ